MELLTRLEISNNTAQSQQASIADLRATAEALVTTSELHQQNFEVIAQEIRQLTEAQRNTNTVLDRMGTILEFLAQGRGGSS